MANTVVEIPDGTSSSQDQGWTRTYSRAFRVTTDNPYKRAGTARAAVMSAFSLSIGTHYKVFDSNGTTILEEDTGSFIQRITATYDGGGDNDGLDWLVTVEYGPFDATTFGANPIDHPLKISWGTAKFEKAVEKDINGVAIVNSAGDYFDPPPTIDDSRTILRITKNLATFDPTIAHDFKDSINSDTWHGYPPRTWKVEDITAELKFNAECGWYEEVTFELALNPDLWKKEILDQGLRKLSGGSQANIKDTNGEDITSPMLLNGSGAPLAPLGTPTYLLFQVYKERAFSGLGLDFTGAPGWGGS